MKKKSFFLFFFLFLLFISTSLQAQQAVADLKSQFKKNEKFEWWGQYSGRVNDASSVLMTLVAAKKEIKGTFEYLRSRKQFRLEGELRKDSIYLKEYDSNNNLTATLIGKISDEQLELVWKAIDNQAVRHFYLLKEENPKDYPTHCGENKWIRHYEGDLRRENISLTLTRSINHQVLGSLHHFGQKKTYAIEGTEKDNKLFLNQLDENNKILNTFILNADNNSEIQGFYITQENKELACRLFLEKELNVGCVDYDDYISSYYLTYPKSRNQGFNDLVEDKISQWKTAVRSKTLAANKVNPKPVYRTSTSAFAWTKTHFLNRNIISTTLYFSSSWDNIVENMTINYDFKKDRVLTLETLFKDKDKGMQFVKSTINKHTFHKNRYNNILLKNWLTSQTFEHFYYQHDGICFSTDFHPIFGTHTCTISYDDLAPYLKED